MGQSNSVYKAILNEQCPRCRSGAMFKYSKYNISKFTDMHQSCPSCNQVYDVEPGFFFGAMFVAYGLIVSMVFVVWLFLYFIVANPPFSVYVITIVSLNILLLPLLFRYSRVIYLYALGGIKYEPNKIKNERY